MNLIAAIPYGKDGLSGDSVYYPGTDPIDTLNYIEIDWAKFDKRPSWRAARNPKNYYKIILALWKRNNLEIEPKYYPIGFWLLTKAQLTALSRFQNALPFAGNDSLCYSNNRASKNFVAAISQLQVGQLPIVRSSS
jgi:hypothetical protein